MPISPDKEPFPPAGRKLSRTHRLNLMVTEKEKAELEDAARLQEETISAWCRRAFKERIARDKGSK